MFILISQYRKAIILAPSCFLDINELSFNSLKTYLTGMSELGGWVAVDPQFSANV